MTKQLPRLLLLVIATFFAASGYAHDVEIDGIFYNLNADSKTASVTFEGSNYYSYDDEYIGNVVIPASITSDGDTYSVTSIGELAFSYCSSLTSVTIPSSVTSIGKWAFNLCSGLTSVTISEGVTNIGERAFVGCNSLTSVTIPSSVTSIGKWAFRRSNSLTAINVSSDNSEYSSADGILYDKDKTCLYVCPGGKIGVATLPSSMTSIEKYAFDGCSGLTAINVSSDNSEFSSADGILYDKDKTCLHVCPGGKVGVVTIPSSVTSIGEDAFRDCSGLTSVTIPSSVTSIGMGAFWYCSGLTSVTIPSSVTSIEENTFYGCSSLTSVTIPSSVTSIESWAFCDCSGLTSVTIPSSVTSIGEYTFYGCSSLASVTIPSSVTSIGEWAFCDCSGLEAIYSFNPVPPICYDDYSLCNYQTATLYVPYEALQAYQRTAPWSYFYNIQGFDATTGIDDIEAGGSGKQETYYDLNGRKSATPHHGVNIVRSPKGITRKVIMK